MSNYGKRSFLILSFLLICLLLVGIPLSKTAALADSGWDGTVSATISGSGTEEDPFLLSTAGDFAYLAEAVKTNVDGFSGKIFKVDTKEIDFGGKSVSIGYYAETEVEADEEDLPPVTKPFNGIFYGNDVVIKNYSAVATEKDNTPYLGLFGMVGKDAGIYDITLQNSACTVTNSEGTDKIFYYGIVGYNMGKLQNLTIAETTVQNVEEVALTGINYEGGKIIDCTAKGICNIYGGSDVAGIAVQNYGSIFDSSVRSVYNFGEENDSLFSGIACENEGTISRSSVKIDSINTYGFAGISFESKGEIEYCYVHADATADIASGLVVTNIGSVDSCYFYGDLVAKQVSAVCITNTEDAILNNLSAIGSINYNADTTDAKVYAVCGQNYGTISNIVLSVDMYGEIDFLSQPAQNVYLDRAFFVNTGDYESLFGIQNASVIEIGSGWNCLDGKIPVINELYNYSEWTKVDYDIAVSFTQPIVVTIGEEYVFSRNGIVALPTIEKIGYVFNGWRCGEDIFTGKEYFTEDCVLTADFSLTAIEYEGITVIGETTKKYDGENTLLTGNFTYPLPLSIEWKYSADGVTYSVVGTGNSYTAREVISSGYYYCTATYDDGSDSVSVDSEIVYVLIYKADYSDLTTYPYTEESFIYGGNYSGKTLQEYTLAENFYWVDESIVPTVDQSKYMAYFNADSQNYNDYYIEINLTLDKGNYSSIKYDYDGEEAIYAGRWVSDKTLANIGLNNDFYWKSPENSLTIGVAEYEAVYNADSVNYNDYELTISVKTDKAQYSGITHPTINDIVYFPDIKLSDISLQEYFTWKNGDEKPIVGKTSYEAVYNDDPVHFEDLIVGINVFLMQASPIVNPTVQKTLLYYGESLPEIYLSEGDTEGEISFDAEEAFLGIHYYRWTFVPADGNYLTVFGEIELEVVYMELVDLIVDSSEAKADYVAFDTFDRTGLKVVAVFNGEKTITLQEQEYSVRYLSEDGCLYYGDAYITVEYTFEEVTKTAEIDINVSKVEIAIPADKNIYRYDGNAQQSRMVDTSLYTVVSSVGTLPGEYTVKLTLTDSNNYKWIGVESADTDITWSILPMLVAVPTVTGEFVYNGTTQYSGIYDTDCYTVKNGEGQVNAGLYYITLCLTDTDLYNWDLADELCVNDVELEWFIDYCYVSDPKILQTEYVYNGGFVSFLYEAEGGAVANIYGGIEVGDYEMVFSLQNGNYRWASNPLLPTRTLYMTINPLPIVLPQITKKFVYDGSEKHPYTEGDTAVSAENNTAVIVGKYQLVLTLTSRNYCWAGYNTSTIYIDWEIEPQKVALPQNGTNPTYTGKVLYADIPLSEIYSLSDNSAVNAGDYTAILHLNDSDNYSWSDGTTMDKEILWKIEKKVLDVPTVMGSYVYNGTEITAVVDDTECIVTDNVGKTAGTYYLTVALPDSINYIWADETSQNKTVEWAIGRCKVQRPTVLRECVYNGTEQNAPINESNYYTYTNGKNTLANTYVSAVSLVDKANYSWEDGSIDDFTLTWVINKGSVEKPEVNDTLIYSGEAQKVKIAETEYYTVEGTGTTPGVYTATVTLRDVQNYQWDDGTNSSLSIPFHIYAINLVIDGISSQQTYVAGTSLPVPTKGGYNFAGWYLTSDFSSEPVTSISTLDGDIKLYARWVSDGMETQIKPDDKKGLSINAIIGISVAGVGALIAIAIIILVLKRK